MVIEDLDTSKLKALMNGLNNPDLKLLLEDKINKMKDEDFNKPVIDTNTMLAREYKRGMYNGYKAVLSLSGVIQEELDLREQELAQQNKK